MISITEYQETVENKDKDFCYDNSIVKVIRLFGIPVLRTKFSYKCTPADCDGKKGMGFKTKDK